MDPRFVLDMTLFHHAKRNRCVLRLLALVRHFGEGTCVDSRNLRCWDRLLHCFYVVQDAEGRWRELDFKTRQRRGSLNAPFFD